MTLTNDMDLGELKTALAALAKQAELQMRAANNSERTRKSRGFKRGLWPLWLGQTLQMVLGLVMIVIGVASWTQHRGDFGGMWYGLVVHAYGVVCIIAAGVLMGRLAKINPTASVVDMQRQLAQTRKTYVIGGMVVGLAWWLFWIPFIAALADIGTNGHVDFFTNMGVAIWICVGLGVLGLIGTAWFHRWSRNPARPRLKQAMEHAVTGGTLMKAQRKLNELQDFETL